MLMLSALCEIFWWYCLDLDFWVRWWPSEDGEEGGLKEEGWKTARCSGKGVRRVRSSRGGRRRGGVEKGRGGVSGYGCGYGTVVNGVWEEDGLGVVTSTSTPDSTVLWWEVLE